MKILGVIKPRRPISKTARPPAALAAELNDDDNDGDADDVEDMNLAELE
jgi:hypothetical protein